MAQSGTLRSPSTSSLLSSITVGNDASRSTSAGSTPPTSVTDRSSTSSVVGKQARTSGIEGERVRRVRRSVASYNENVLAAGKNRALPRKNIGEVNRTVSGETLIEGDTTAQKKLVQDSIQALNLEWSVDGMPGDDMKMTKKHPSDGVLRRRSARSNVLERASAVIESTKSILGKRGRSLVDAGKDKMQGLSRKSSLRRRHVDMPPSEASTAKKVKLTAAEDSNCQITDAIAKRRPTQRPRVKRWLSHGLYIGQDRDFDPRLTETKNKLNRISKELINTEKKLNPPLPMFAGHRTLVNGRDFRLPFDIFSPLPPGQPKPDEWRKTQKNVFIGDAALVWKKSKPLEASKCICDDNSGCDENCYNRFMFYECDDSNCNISAEQCTNRAFAGLRQRCKAGGKYNIGVEVIKTADRGYGVRSNRTFDPHQIIVEYAGEIVTQDECDDRMRTRYKDNECFYLMVFDQNMIIDATRGSIARFVNHSCEPNCRMVKWTVAGKPRMALFAGEKGVMTADELTYDYNFDPFSSKNIQQCRCGTPTCRGVLGPKTKDQAIKPTDTNDVLKPLLSSSTKSKVTKAAKTPLDAMIAKRRTVFRRVNLSSALSKVKAQSATSITRTGTLSSSSKQHPRPVKKSLQRSQKDTIKTHQSSSDTKAISGNHVPRNREQSSVRLSTGPQASIEIGQGSATADTVSTKRNVVRTVRRSTGGLTNPSIASGKTIRVIAKAKQSQG